MRIEYNHKLSKDEAYTRLQGLLLDLQRQYAGQISDAWSEWNKDHTQMRFRASIRGFETTGNVYLMDKQVILEGSLPFMARLFSGKIEKMIRERLEALLS